VECGTAPPAETMRESELRGMGPGPARIARHLDPPGRHNPEQFWRDKTELAGQIAALAYDAERRLG
jgi:hypothetical protein